MLASVTDELEPCIRSPLCSVEDRKEPAERQRDYRIRDLITESLNLAQQRRDLRRCKSRDAIGIDRLHDAEGSRAIVAHSLNDVGKVKVRVSDGVEFAPVCVSPGKIDPHVWSLVRALRNGQTIDALQHCSAEPLQRWATCAA